MKVRFLPLLLVGLALALGVRSWGTTAGMTRQDILIVVNQASPTSLRIGEYYRLARGIPKNNVCAINCPTTETTSLSTYQEQIATPVKDFLTTHSLQDQIKCIVTTKGVPLRMAQAERYGSIDSALALLLSDSTYGRMGTGAYTPPQFSAISNPFYGSNRSYTDFRSLPRNNSTMEAFPQMRDIALLPGGEAVAVGNKGLIVRGSSDSWTLVDDQRKSYNISNYTAVSFVSASEGWAATEDGKVYMTTNTGQDWARVRAALAERYRDIALISSSEHWIVGESIVTASRTQPLILHYTGSSWASEASGLTTGSLLSVTAPDNTHVWACGSNGVILRRTGGAWSRLASGVPITTYRSITFLNSGGQYRGWAVGDGGLILHTNDGGNTWTQQSSGVTGRLSQVFALDSNHAWVTRDWQHTDLLQTTDAGATWSRLQADNNGKLAVAFNDPLNGYAVGNEAATGRFAILTTTDGGASWSTSFAGADTTWRLNYLVSRLDGYSADTDNDGLPDDVKAIIDRARTPEPTGAFLLDICPSKDTGGYKLGNDQLRAAKDAIVAIGRTVIDDEDLGLAWPLMTGDWLRGRLGYTPSVGGYCSWGSNDFAAFSNTAWAKPSLSWSPGAIAMTYVSTDGRTYDTPDFLNASSNSIRTNGAYSNPNQIRILNPYVGWRFELHDNASGLTYTSVASGGQAVLDFTGSVTSGYLQLSIPDPNSSGSFIPLPGAILNASTSQPIAHGNDYVYVPPQSLTADLIHEGCSGVIGNTAEPYLDACGCPDQTLPKYAQGFTWAESAYAGLRYLAWQEVAVGDPLMAPYAPIVKITSPTKGAAVSGSVVITTTATDPQGVNRAELLIDGVSSGTLTSAPYQWTINTTTLPDGKHDVEVAAYRDAASGTTFRGYDYTQLLVSNSAPIKSPAQAAALPNNSLVAISGAVATTDSSAFPNGIYVEHPARISGLRVSLPSGEQLYEGDVISARGTMSTSDGERVLVATDVVYGDWMTPLKPLGFAGVRVGGRSPISEIPALPGSSGVYNVGLLVRLIGKVIPGGSDYFYLDDGSGLLDNSGMAGVRIKCSSLTKPTGGFVAVAGVAGAETINGALARVIRVRKQDDIVPITAP